MGPNLKQQLSPPRGLLSQPHQRGLGSPEGESWNWVLGIPGLVSTFEAPYLITAV